MKKTLFAFVLVLGLVISMVGSAFAASGVSADEQKVLDEFTAAVNKWSALLDTNAKATNGKISAQYIAEATTALTKVDLDSAACADLSSAVAAALAIIDNANPTTGKEMRAIMPSVVERVNQTSKNYGMTVSVDSETGYATVTIDGKVVGTTKPVVNQTGADMTGTYVVVAALLAALVGAVVVISRKKATVR